MLLESIRRGREININHPACVNRFQNNIIFGQVKNDTTNKSDILIFLVGLEKSNFFKSSLKKSIE